MDYKDIAVKLSLQYPQILGALRIIEKYIIREQKIVVGGQAIDFALKLKGHQGIYTDELPDYDIFSDEHFIDAYNIAEWLVRTGYQGINVINALHPTTMRVRMYSIPLVDITYIPENVLNIIPTLRFKNFKIIHPHIQMINQHRALSYPYENAEIGSVLYRNKKDMERYDLLYSYYPIRVLQPFQKRGNLVPFSISLEKDLCISGTLALLWWIKHASSLGFTPSIYIGKLEQNDKTLHGEYYNLGLSFYSSQQNLTATRNKFLDYMPESSEDGTIYHLVGRLAAHKEKFYVANLQVLMMEFLMHYCLNLEKIHHQEYYDSYIICRDIINWAAKHYSEKADKKYEVFFPTSEFYGNENTSEAKKVASLKFQMQTGKIPAQIFQPANIYGFVNKSIPEKYWKFDITKSPIFSIDGSSIMLKK